MVNKNGVRVITRQNRLPAWMALAIPFAYRVPAAMPKGTEHTHTAGGLVRLESSHSQVPSQVLQGFRGVSSCPAATGCREVRMVKEATGVYLEGHVSESSLVCRWNDTVKALVVCTL